MNPWRFPVLSPQRIQLVWMGLLASVAFCSLAGCRMGFNHPQIQNALEMSRVERDAAEDQYYQLKKEYDEAVLQIDDLKNELQQRQAPSTDEASQLAPLNDVSSNTYPQIKPSEKYPVEQVSSTIGFDRDSNASEISELTIALNQTRGFDSHGKSGDDGIIVALKPLDKNGRFINTPGTTTISLIDPALTGIRQRVGLWRFSAEEVRERIDPESETFVFRLPWQRTNPKNSRLKLFARIQTENARLESESDVNLVLDGEPRSRWTNISATPDSKSPDSKSPDSKSQDSKSQASGSLNSDQGRSVAMIPSDTSLPVKSGGSTNPSTRSPESSAVQGVQIARPQWSPYR
jgi:hypothetical protein